MSVVEVLRNGQHKRHEPLPAPITPEELAKLIASEVTKQLGSVRRCFIEAAASAAGSMVEQLARAAATDATSAIKEAGQQMMLQAKECFQNMQAIIKDAEDTTRRLSQYHEMRIKEMDAIGKIKKAEMQLSSVNVLTKIIGEEIKRYELQTMISDEIAKAVRGAFQQLGVKT